MMHIPSRFCYSHRNLSTQFELLSEEYSKAARKKLFTYSLLPLIRKAPSFAGKSYVYKKT
jgi:hypothetical protein